MDGILLKQIKKELSEKLCSGFITKIHQPAPYVFNFQFRNNRQNLSLLIILAPRQQGIFITENNPKNPPNPTAFTMLLRKYLEREILQSIEQPAYERVLIFNFNRHKLVIEFTGRHRNLIVLKDNLVLGALKYQNIHSQRPLLINEEYQFPPAQDKIPLTKLEISDLIELGNLSLPLWRALFNRVQGIGPQTSQELARWADIEPEKDASTLDKDDWQVIFNCLKKLDMTMENSQGQAVAVYKGDEIVSFLSFLPPENTHLKYKTFPSYSALLDETIYPLWQEKDLNKRKEPLRKNLTQLLKRNKRKHGNLAEDLDKAHNYDQYRIFGELLMTYGHLVPKGAQTISLPNFYDEEKPLEIKLKAQYSPQENANIYFKQYRKRKNAIEFLQKQQELNKQEISYLEQSLHFLAEAQEDDEILELEKELKEAGYIKGKTNKKTKNQASKILHFTTEEGIEVYIGRNNKQNDRLVRQANPEDLWFHVKDLPGSHVILKIAGKNYSDNSLLMAANTAAYYSNGRLSSKVDVDYTEVKNLKKPKGSPLGYVIYHKYKTISASPKQYLKE